MPVMPRVRRVVARHPWVQWVVIVSMAVVVTAVAAEAMARVDAERASWGRTTSVWVAVRDVQAGEPIEAEQRDVPEAVRPPGAVVVREGAVARQAVGRGEIVTDLDVVDPDGSIAPPEWLVAPVRESLPSGATIGEHVQVASDGFVLASDGIVVGFVDDATLVAVPPDIAPLLPAAAAAALLRTP